MLYRNKRIIYLRNKYFRRLILGIKDTRYATRFKFKYLLIYYSIFPVIVDIIVIR